MDRMLGGEVLGGDAGGWLPRVVRVSMLVYLSPVILAVLAVGLFGHLAGLLRRPAPRPGSVLLARVDPGDKVGRPNSRRSARELSRRGDARR